MMLKRTMPFVFGFLSGALIVGGFMSRIYRGTWDSGGPGVVFGVLFSIATLFVAGGIEDKFFDGL